MQSSASPHLLTRVSQDQSMLVTGVTEMSHLVSLVPQSPHLLTRVSQDQ